MKHFLLISLSISSVICLICPDGYTLVNNKCLSSYKSSNNHSDAESLCRATYGTLANIRSAIDNRAIADWAAQNKIDKVWIGVFCFGNDTSSCVYDDESGALTSYNSFANQNPLVNASDYGCVYMQTTGQQAGKWFSASCSSTNIGAVCEVPPSSQEPEANGYYCTQFGDYNYCRFLLLSDQNAMTCQKLSGNLLSIHSKSENDFVAKQLTYSNHEIALGAKRLSTGVYAYLDGSSFSDFDNRDLLDTIGTGDCLKVDRNTGLWKKIICNTYIDMCKIPLQPVKVASNCNNTAMLMAPVTITSYGYPDYITPLQPCTYHIATTGTYKLAITFTNYRHDYFPASVLDGDGNYLEASTYSNIGTRFISPSNVITVESDGKQFTATVLPY